MQMEIGRERERGGGERGGGEREKVEGGRGRERGCEREGGRERCEEGREGGWRERDTGKD